MESFLRMDAVRRIEEMYGRVDDERTDEGPGNVRPQTNL